MMGADPVEVSAGSAYLQTASLPQLSGAVTINSGNYTGFSDYNDMGTPTANVALTGSMDTARGVLTLAD